MLSTMDNHKWNYLLLKVSNYDKNNYFSKLFFNSCLARINNYKHFKNKIGDSGQPSTNLIKSNLIMKYLNSEEYNTILLAITQTREYQIKSIGSKKEFYETLFEKLFTIQESDLLQNESINHPISKS